MKPLSTLSAADVSNIKLLSFDADGVTVEKGTEILEKNGVLTVSTKQITSQLLEKINKLKSYFHINFTSGRSLLYLNRMFGPVLWEKASIQGENGLFALINGQVLQYDRLTSEELEKIEDIKRQIRVLAQTNQNIRGFEPKQFLVSVHCYKEEKGIEEIVRRTDTNSEFYILWNGEAYDIFPKRFNKGAGLEFLCKHLEINLDQALAVGNDPNDAPLMSKVGVGVTTSPQTLEASYHTEEKLDLGGEETVDHLLSFLPNLSKDG